MEVPEGFIDISTDSDKGVLKKILKDGDGEATPKSGATVFVHYTGTLFGGEKDGEKFDSSRDRGEKFSFTLGEGQVIKAWDTGVATMKRGEICELICAPAYAYGEQVSGSIPANATLKFEVELFDWKGKDISPSKDGSLTQIIIVAGTGYESPKDCVPVKITVKGMYNDVVFDERDVQFEVGDCSSSDLICGIEIAVRKMKKNEKSLFDIGPEHAFGVNGNSVFNIPGNVAVKYEITLKEFEKIKESYSLESSKEKLEFSGNFKVRATEKFQAGKYLYASKLYEKAVSYIEYDTDFTDESDKAARLSLLLSLRLNLSLCHLKMTDYGSAISESDKALVIDPTNEKGLYRRGQALMAKGDYEKAKESFQTLLSHNDANKQAVGQLKMCDAKIRENLNLEKKLYQTMLSKIGQGGSDKHDVVQGGSDGDIKDTETAANGV